MINCSASVPQNNQNILLRKPVELWHGGYAVNTAEAITYILYGVRTYLIIFKKKNCVKCSTCIIDINKNIFVY